MATSVDEIDRGCFMLTYRSDNTCCLNAMKIFETFKLCLARWLGTSFMFVGFQHLSSLSLTCKQKLSICIIVLPLASSVTYTIQSTSILYFWKPQIRMFTLFKNLFKLSLLFRFQFSSVHLYFDGHPTVLWLNWIWTDNINSLIYNFNMTLFSDVAECRRRAEHFQRTFNSLLAAARVRKEVLKKVSQIMKAHPHPFHTCIHVHTHRCNTI